MYQRPSVDIEQFLGLNDSPNGFRLKPGECATFDNFITNGYSAEKRPGYTRRISTAQAGANKVTGLGQFLDSSNVRHFLAVINGKLYEDVSGTLTERAAGRTIDASALCQVIGSGSQPSSGAHTGSAIINDQNNPPLIWSGTGTADILIPDITRAGCIAGHKNFVFLGDYTSTREGRSICTVGTTSPDDPQTLSTIKSPTNRQSRVIAMIPTADYVLIFLENEVWWAIYAPSSGGFGGGVAFNFDFRVLRPGIGIVGPLAVVNVAGEMTAFWARGKNNNGGPHVILDKDPQAGPIYIGKPIETFISGLDPNYLSGIVLSYLPGNNCIKCIVPYGSAQATNNYACVYNITDKTWGIWLNESNPYAFASAANTIDSDLSSQLYCGTYDGLIMKMGTGLQDDGDGYRSEMWTGWLGSNNFEKDWQELVLRMDLGQRKIIQVRARYFASGVEDAEDATGGASGDPIGSFAIGVSAIAGQSVGAMVGDLEGDPSTHIQIGIIDEQINVPCRIHGMTAYYGKGTSWVQSAA